MLVQIPSRFRRNPFRKSGGWTLIELMMVISIVAVLTAIAYPAYTEQVRKSKRADAINSLMASAQVLERCFTRLNAYNADACPNPAGASTDGHYTITLVRTATTYTLTATPQADQANDSCGTFTLDHLGNKAADEDGVRCWGS